MHPDILPMWRCIVAIAHADGKVHDKERTYLLGMFDNMQRAKTLTAEQRAVLEQDLEVQQDPFEMLSLVQAPAYKSQVLHFALYLAKVDGVIDPSEQDLIDRLHAQIRDKSEETLRAQARAVLDYQPQPKVKSAAPPGVVAFAEDLMNWSES